MYHEKREVAGVNKSSGVKLVVGVKNKNLFILLVLCFAILGLAGCSSGQPDQAESALPVPEVDIMGIQGVNIQWLGHSGFRLDNDKVIYIDPFQLTSDKIAGKKADILLITHEHYDHCSVQDIKNIVKPETIIVTVPDCQSKFSGLQVANVTLVTPGRKLNVRGTMIETVPAYNLNKKFHPKENEWVGFIITVNGRRVYHSGDTDAIPEMKALKDIDIALVPVSGTYVMTPEEAAAAVNTFKPKVAVPMHWGNPNVIGTKNDAEKFRSLVKGEVVILG